MPFYYLDPTREPQDCPACEEGEVCEFEPLIGERWSVCILCGGTGRLGVEGEEPDVETVELPPIPEAGIDEPQWFYRYPGVRDALFGPYPTEAAALSAARRAHWTNAQSSARRNRP